MLFIVPDVTDHIISVIVNVLNYTGFVIQIFVLNIYKTATLLFIGEKGEWITKWATPGNVFTHP